MLRELPSTRQIPGEKQRRWFFSNEIDLVVWFDDSGAPCGFELAYDKAHSEHSISWKIGRGFRHYVVDEGNSPGGHPETPFLYADGPFDSGRVLLEFEALSAEIPPAIAKFVGEKLATFPGRFGV